MRPRGNAVTFTKSTGKPILPTPEQTAVLRRAAQGAVICTMVGGRPEYTYEDGSYISLTPRAIARMVANHWLVPDEDSLFKGPAQRYTARKPSEPA